MQGVSRGSYIYCVLCLFSAVWSHVGAAGLPDCSAEMDGTLEQNSLHITGNCTWGSAVAAAPKLSIVGVRTSLGVHSSNSATPVVFAAASTQKSTVMKGKSRQPLSGSCGVFDQGNTHQGSSVYVVWANM